MILSTKDHRGSNQCTTHPPQWLFKHKKGRSEALSISAARMKREGVMLSLLKMGLSAIEPCGDYGHSPLELACRQNFHHVVKWLFAREDVRSTETQQITDAVDALFIAAEWGAAECLQIMLTPPSPLIERLNRRNLKDQCALEVAAHHSRSEQVCACACDVCKSKEAASW